MHKIFLVEDEKMVADVIKHFLEHKGYETVIANNLKDGMDLFSNEFEVVLLDIQLGMETSFPLLKRIKEENPNTLVLMFSGYDSEEYIREAKKLGADGFIPKPFRVEFLDDFLLPKLDYMRRKREREEETKSKE